MNVAFIPVRGGSKSIPLKNIKEICGKPLVYWTIKAAVMSKNIDIVYVSTDSEQIQNVVNSFNFERVKVISRSAQTASDTASTESAMLEFAQTYDFDNIILIQATSPMLKTDDIDGGLNLYQNSECDSVLSVVRQYRFLWKKAENKTVTPQNYDVYNRPRRQDFNGYLMENGAFYITSRKALLKSKNRIFGRIMAYEMPEYTAFEIDEPSDWVIIEQLMKKLLQKSISHRIKMLLTDCDGCLTDGGMYYSEYGDELKKFNTRDGMAFQLMRKKGIITGIITSENVELNRRRAEKLNADELHMGVKDKLQVVKTLADKYNISLDEIAYIGDDLNDLPVLKQVGFSCCPHNAIQKVKDIVDFVTISNGGNGVIREVAEILYDI